MKRNLVLNKIEIVGFVGYFLILLIERIMAIALSYNVGEQYSLASGNWFPIVAYSLTCLSVLGTVILLPKLFIGMFKALFSKEEYDFNANLKYLIITTMVALLGGMMHTGQTMAPLQFVAYGLLIVSMLIRTIISIYDKTNKFDAIISLIYLTFYSMTIPVCYMVLPAPAEQLTPILEVAFYVYEFITTFALLTTFGLMLYEFFTDGKSKFSFRYLIIMFVLCASTIAFKWINEINMFVLIFVAATTLTYFIYMVRDLIRTKKEIDQEPKNE